MVFDVKCSGRLAQVIKAKGGKPVLSRTGHAFMKRRMTGWDTPLAGEMSGRIYFNERWYGFDDGMYTAARMLEILMGLNRKPSEVFGKLPSVAVAPDVYVSMPDEEAEAIVAKLKESTAFGEVTVPLGKGDQVVFCSDGLVEAVDETGEPFGFDRLAETIREACEDGLTAGRLRRHLVNTVVEYQAGEQADDMTIIVTGARR